MKKSPHKFHGNKETHLKSLRNKKAGITDDSQKKETKKADDTPQVQPPKKEIPKGKSGKSS